MNEQLLPYLHPRRIEIPTQVLHGVYCVQEEMPKNGMVDFERRLMSAVVDAANTILHSDDFSKDPLPITENTQLYRYNNCTDVASLQLALFEAVDIEALGRFDGYHASVVVPSGTSYWYVGGELPTDLKYSACKNAFELNGKIDATQKGLDELQNNDGVYVYYSEEDNKWKTKEFSGENIREASPVKRKADATRDLHDAFIMTKPQLARRMFHAVDILGTITKDPKHAPRKRGYLCAKTALKHLVPRLS